MTNATFIDGTIKEVSPINAGNVPGLRITFSHISGRGQYQKELTYEATVWGESVPKFRELTAGDYCFFRGELRAREKEVNGRTFINLGLVLDLVLLQARGQNVAFGATAQSPHVHQNEEVPF